jgi:hypothetical protein
MNVITGRRSFLLALGSVAVAWPVRVRAQRAFKIGLLDAGLGTSFSVPFLRRLVELGYV